MENNNCIKSCLQKTTLLYGPPCSIFAGARDDFYFSILYGHLSFFASPMLVEAPFVFFNNTGKVQRCMEAFNNGFHSYFSTLLCQDLFEFSVVDGKNVVQHSADCFLKGRLDRPLLESEWKTFSFGTPLIVVFYYIISFYRMRIP